MVIIMKILLIAPVKNPDKKTRNITRFPMISLLYIAALNIAALTPACHEVEIVEEEVEAVNYEAQCDPVAITCITATAKRAYTISQEFRRRRKNGAWRNTPHGPP